jgi:hypothetical protein
MDRNCRQRRKLFSPKSQFAAQCNKLRQGAMLSVYLASEGQSFQPVTTVAGQVDREIRVSVRCILNHQHYLLKFQRGLCWYNNNDHEDTGL